MSTLIMLDDQRFGSERFGRGAMKRRTKTKGSGMFGGNPGYTRVVDEQGKITARRNDRLMVRWNPDGTTRLSELTPAEYWDRQDRPMPPKTTKVAIGNLWQLTSAALTGGLTRG